MSKICNIRGAPKFILLPDRGQAEPLGESHDWDLHRPQVECLSMQTRRDSPQFESESKKIRSRCFSKKAMKEIKIKAEHVAESIQYRSLDRKLML